MPRGIETLNADCTCITLDREKLCRALTEVAGNDEFCRKLTETHPHLISAQPLFLTADHVTQMLAIIRAIESVVELPTYRQAVQKYAPEIARYRPGTIGAFMGYDFHLGPDGPKLIEINTNAGGALINAYVLEAQRACCAEMALSVASRIDLETRLALFVESFRNEWRRQRPTLPLQSIAIVDEAPASQYLYPEFVGFQRLFERHGIRATIIGPEMLAHRDHALWMGENRIDLVYNRLTDFYLSQPQCSQLRSAYLAGDAVVTPNPWAHAHLADKRNLALLSDATRLRDWGISPDVVSTLTAGIPRTFLVTPEEADALWARRNWLFFKPSAGYGSKATYRGDKITQKVWSEILAASYVAQDIVPPSSRTIAIDGKLESMKADLRCYTYDGQLLLLAARLYQGQTTNFRTPGGGFAPVLVGAGDAACRC